MRAPPHVARSAAPRSRAASGGPRSRQQLARAGAGTRGRARGRAYACLELDRAARISVSGTKRPPKRPKWPPASGSAPGRSGPAHGCSAAARASVTKRRTRSGSLRPGRASTPGVDVHRVGSDASRTAAATLSGVSPAERSTGCRRRRRGGHVPGDRRRGLALAPARAASRAGTRRRGSRPSWPPRSRRRPATLIILIAGRR